LKVKTPLNHKTGIMQKILLITTAFLLVFSISISAQTVNQDSLSLISKIEEDQQKLSDLQMRLEERSKIKKEALAKAQKSADENAEAADKLSSDPRHKRLAKKADKAASEARKDAKTARKETDKLDRLNKEIRDTKKRIAKNEKRLKKYTQPKSPMAG
jgi:uncharacterized protein YhaN